MDKMFGYEYVQGYTAALQDVLETINDIQDDLKNINENKILKHIKLLLNVC